MAHAIGERRSTPRPRSQVACHLIVPRGYHIIAHVAQLHEPADLSTSLAVLLIQGNCVCTHLASIFETRHRRRLESRLATHKLNACAPPIQFDMSEDIVLPTTKTLCRMCARCTSRRRCVKGGGGGAMARRHGNIRARRITARAFARTCDTKARYRIITRLFVLWFATDSCDKTLQAHFSAMMRRHKQSNRCRCGARTLLFIQVEIVLV